jgi:hypothetical protein
MVLELVTPRTEVPVSSDVMTLFQNASHTAISVCPCCWGITVFVSLPLPVLFKSVDHFSVWWFVLSLTECTCSCSLVTCLVFVYSTAVLKHLFQTAWFLAAFPKQMGKATISFVMFVPPPNFPHETTWLPSDRFTWDWYWGLLDRRHVPILAKLRQEE